ncbi:MAG: PSD1 domain-containing protein [Fuerstia sp.]|nr:PSD1 domain-containing protein [Fuerstiella sp.]
MSHSTQHTFVIGLLIAVTSDALILADDAVRFGRDVLPILSTNCYACHGPDKAERKANLRFDIEADAKAEHDSGVPIVPGKPNDSTLIQRIESTDPDVLMPPPDSHKNLKPAQIETLRRWVAEGAEWGRHWSFEPVERPAIDVPAGTSPIDVLVATTLARKGLTLRPAAQPHQLARRVWLDVVGVPPTIEAADAFAANPDDEAYEAMIDELLASPKFGEHWARMWMDLARYADTKGYEKDLGRTVWPYRDWLVNAINADMRLDQMTLDQLAGDLLPNSTNEQLVATAFHRNTMSNDEGGTDDEEFRTIAVKDRVDTTLQVWMGLTAGCAKCHTHKYDPISQAEYYSLYAILNQTQDADRPDDAPTQEIISPAVEEGRKRLAAKLADLKSQLEHADEAAARKEADRWSFGTIEAATSANGATLKARDDGSIFVDGASTAEDVYVITLKIKSGRHTLVRIEALPEKFADGQVGVGRNPRDPNFVLSELEVELLNGTDSQPLKLASPRADFEQGGWPVTAALDGDTKTGWAVSPRQRERHLALIEFAEPLELVADAVLRFTLRQHYGDSLTLRRFRISTIGEDAASVNLPEASPEQRRLVDEIAAANAELASVNSKAPKVPVMRAMNDDKLRTTHIHRRGNFLDPGDEVAAGLPAAFHKLPDNTPINRLALAQWLMSPENTLTPRVWANRIWARLFGIGIVETEEDFGALGALPTHPELLDWLAAEYRDNGWSLKRFLKTIVMSRTYRQSSAVTADLRSIDPRNELLSRGARFRLSAETVRDESLAVSGLLSDNMGGPPVMPPQPDGMWRSTYNGQKWINAEGEDRFRRALYTYLKRTTPYPSMTTFDGGSGEVCQIRRIRTNTPLQALVTLNDPVYLEAAGALARHMAFTQGSAAGKASHGLRRALIRPVLEGESVPLTALQQDVQKSYSANSQGASSLIKSTRTTTPDGMTDAEFASWIVVANTILNLDEFLTRN